MSDDPNNQPDPTPADNPPADPVPPTPAKPKDGETNEPGPVPYERFKAVNDRAKTAESELETLKTAQKKREEDELVEQEKWKDLAEKRDGELKAERLRNDRLEVAQAKGLAPELAERLRGDTREELEADAERLLEFVKPSEGPGVPPAPRGGTPLDIKLEDMSPAEIREALDKDQLG